MTTSQIVVLVCCIYFVTMIVTGIIASRKNKKDSDKKATDFLVAGRGLNVVLTAATLAAVQIGVGIVMGSATNGYNDGLWPGVWYAIGCGGGLILAGLLVTKKLRKKDSYVPIDYFAERYGESRGVRLWAWISNVPSMLGIFVSQILACGSVLVGFGIPFEWGVVLCAVVILIYCAIGGMWGVVLTDAIQTGIIVVGIPILAVCTLIQFSNAGGDVVSIFTTPFIPKGMFSKFVYLVLPFFLSISVSYDAYMRIQAAKDAKTASKGCIIGGILVIIVGILCSSVGAASKMLFPGIEDGIFTHAAMEILNPVLAGIVIAAILSAAMSSANCILVSMGASFSRDFYNKFLHPDKTLDELPKAKFISQATIVLGTAAGILLAFKMDNIIDTMIVFNYPYMGSLLIPLLGGLMWKGATRKGAFAAMIAGGIVGVGAFLISVPSPIQGIINSDLSLLIAYSVSVVVMVIVSKMDRSKQPSELTNAK
jgi:SSS family solute:Na+ symporter